MDSASLFTLASGVILLFYGRRYFWLAAGLVAFLFGWQFFGERIGDGWTAVLIGSAAGILFAWLAVKFIRTIAHVIGFLAGALALPFFLGIFGVDLHWLLSATVGGAIGLVLIAAAFGWGLVLLTSWVGAGAVSGSLQAWLDLGETVAGVVFIALLLFGVVYQTHRRRRR
jgi:hypothetical protein